MRNKRQKFVELAEKRVAKAMNDIRLIGNLSNRSAYSFAEDDIKKIFRALQREIDVARARFGGSGSGSEGDFRLS